MYVLCLDTQGQLVWSWPMFVQLGVRTPARCAGRDGHYTSIEWRFTA